MEDNPWESARWAEDKASKQREFYDMLAIGKAGELEAAKLLITKGFVVVDISTTLTSSYKWSPFDLIAFRNSTYIVDVKLRSSIGTTFWFTNRDIEHWEQYITQATKLVMFGVNKDHKSHDFTFIRISKLLQVAFHKRSKFSWHIKKEDTSPIELLDILMR